jgi:VIT1/CCC1 family predicted Fe2+/Mn2+ transporter
MNMKVEDIAKVSSFKLIGTYIKGAKRLATLEKQYVGQVLGVHIKNISLGLILAIAGCVCLALGGFVLLVAIVLYLNTWFMPWASALIVTVALLLIGLVLALIGLLNMKKDIEKAKSTFDQVGEDIRWVRQK